jgi:hypothetical protein
MGRFLSTALGTATGLAKFQIGREAGELEMGGDMDMFLSRHDTGTLTLVLPSAKESPNGRVRYIRQNSLGTLHIKARDGESLDLGSVTKLLPIGFGVMLVSYNEPSNPQLAGPFAGYFALCGFDPTDLPDA